MIWDTMLTAICNLQGLCGVLSLFSSLRYCLGDPADKSNLYWALGFLPFGMFFDFMDGKVARWRKKSSMMGQELDSLADLVRYGRITHIFPLPSIFPSRSLPRTISQSNP